MRRPLDADLRLPGDKSISHRALILAAMAEGASVIEGLSDAEDVRSTWRCLQELGAQVTRVGGRAQVRGAAWRGLRQPRATLDCGNSGTTMRLLLGVLSGQPLHAELTGDGSLRRRPMERVAEPLRRMGASIETSASGTAPVSVRGAALAGIRYELPVASAQVKSAVLLAGTLAAGTTTVVEPAPSRDHTERMLPLFGAELERKGGEISVRGGLRLAAARLRVPGDASAGAFWAAAAMLVPESRAALRGMGVNPTRMAFFDALRRMGAEVRVAQDGEAADEPSGDVVVEWRPLRAIAVEPSEIPGLIDEIPALALAATQARGETRLRGLGELRHKESDRLAGVAELLRALGADAAVAGDDLVVRGPRPLRGGAVRSLGDHRLAMAALVAGLAAAEPVRVDDQACVAVSYPDFHRDLEAVGGR